MRFDDSREELLHLQQTLLARAYLDHIWSQRYPTPSPKPSTAWPYIRQIEKANVIPMSKGKKP